MYHRIDAAAAAAAAIRSIVDLVAEYAHIHLDCSFDNV